MVEFDRPRAIRIVAETAETYREMLHDHQSDVAYRTPEEMLEHHAELQADYDTTVKLGEYLERDCE